MSKKIRIFLTAFLLVFAVAFAGCSSSESEPSIDDKEIFEEDLEPLEGDELEAMEGGSLEDEEMVPVDEEDLEDSAVTDTDEEDSEGTAENISGDTDSDGDDSSTEGSIGEIEEDGTYTSKDEVAVYIHTYGKLPSNYITKSEAKELGWNSSEGNLDEVAPGMSIGGDTYGNYDKMLPEEEGRTYQECDIDYEGGYRNSKRIIYSNDGLIFYTDDHYETFQPLY